MAISGLGDFPFTSVWVWPPNPISLFYPAIKTEDNDQSMKAIMEDWYFGVTAAPAIAFNSHLGDLAVNTASTSAQLDFAATVPVGKLVTVCVAWDNEDADENATEQLTIDDLHVGVNPWVKAKEWTNSQGGPNLGVVCAIFYCRITEELVAHIHDIVISSTHSGRGAITADVWDVDADMTHYATALSEDGVINPAAVTIADLTENKNYLFLHAIGSEGSLSTVTPGTGYTTLTPVLTAGSAAATIAIWPLYRIKVGTGDSDDTVTDSSFGRDIAQVYAAISTAPVTVPSVEALLAGSLTLLGAGR